MPSIVWGRDPEDAFEDPYEYACQEQFSREAHTLYYELYKILNSEQHRYSVNDRSCEKAIWLLAMDALDSQRECLECLDRKEHRIAGKLFRDIAESMDIALYILDATHDDELILKKWYSNEIIPHWKYRNYAKNRLDKEKQTQLNQHYRSLSKFTHRSYHAILGGYSLGKNRRLVHDRSADLYGTEGDSSKFLVVPHTISSYYAILADLTLLYLNQLTKLGLIDKITLRDAVRNSWEVETVPRKLMPRRWFDRNLYDEYFSGNDNQSE